MRKTLAISIMLICVGGAAVAQTTPTKTPNTDEVLKAFRADMQSTRADIVAKNVSLSAEQAAKFWPLFQKYQGEQNVIMDEQLRVVASFIKDFNTLDDAGALALANAHIDRDLKMANLRKKWLGEFQKVLPTKLAVRVMQIDRRLSMVAQFEIASQIPLAH